MNTSEHPQRSHPPTRERWHFAGRHNIDTAADTNLGDYYLWMSEEDHWPTPRHYAMPVEQFWAEAKR